MPPTDPRHRVPGESVRPPAPSESIAVGPDADPHVTAAIRHAGGTPTVPDASSRALVWLAYDRPGELADALDAAPELRWVQLPFAGVDAFTDLLRAHGRPGLIWTSAKGCFAQPVAEHALTLTLALLRLLPERIAASGWGGKGGTSLYGRNVAIVGAGGIAEELIRLLAPFGVRISVVRAQPIPVAGAVATVRFDRLDEVIATADVVVLAAALTETTRGMFGEHAFQRMRETAYLVNVARGGLVDTDALVRALDAGVIAGAALDVTDPEPLPDGHPLWQHPRAIVTPHTADTPEMTAPLFAERVRRNVAAYLGDGRFLGVVDPAAGY